MHLGRRTPTLLPKTYKNFHLVKGHGRVYGVPMALHPDPEVHVHTIQDRGLLAGHPAVLSAASLRELCEQIDAFDDAALDPPPAPPAGDPGATPVEFAGWLPIYEFSGHCGTHPQFKHTDAPPPGYRFVRSAPPKKLPPREPWLSRACTRVCLEAASVAALFRPLFAFLKAGRDISLRARWVVLAAMVRLAARLLRRGCKPIAVARFLQSRHLQSQLALGEKERLVFLTSMPFTYGQHPYVLEIEDPTTLFYPLVHNGRTADLDVKASPYFPIVRTLLEDDSCKAILTHMRSTAELVPTLFGSEAITQKVVYSPLGVPLPRRHQRHLAQPDGAPIDLLFINSWHQHPTGFFLRGGLDVLEAFATLKERYPQLRLTMRTAMPGLDPHYHRILEQGWVRIVNRFVTPEEMAELHASSHIYLLPAARVHIVSLLQAMSYGLAVVASDGWGMQEYLEDERTGLIVRGRHGKVAWADDEAGLLREDYEPMYVPDTDVVQGLVDAVSRLVEDPALRARLGRAARADVATRFTPQRWNEGLKAAFDLARGVAETPAAANDRVTVPVAR